MANKVIIRIAKLSSYGKISASAQHAFRERATPNADPERLRYNGIVGAKNSQEVVDAVRKRIDAIDEKQGHAVKCVEYLITASPEAFDAGGPLSGKKSTAYFNDSLNWIRKRHGAENVVCTVVHLDETTPHMSVYVVPVVQRKATTRKRSVSIKGGGREVREFTVPAKSVLSAKHFFYGKPMMHQMQTDFASDVGAKFDLCRGVKHKRVRHTTVQEFYGQIDVEIEAKRKAAEAEIEQMMVKMQSVVKSTLAEHHALMAKQRKALDDKIADLVQDFPSFRTLPPEEILKDLIAGKRVRESRKEKDKGNQR